MLLLLLAILAVSTGALSVAEAWAERDIPWHCGKYFLLLLVGLLFFLFR